jgi:hypothetical protein
MFLVAEGSQAIDAAVVPVIVPGALERRCGFLLAPSG